MSNARNISKADSRFVNATGDVHAAYALHGAIFNEAGYSDVGNVSRIKLGTAYLPQGGSNVKITVYCGQGYNAVINQYKEYEIHFRTSNGGSNIAGSSGNFYGNGWVKHTASGDVNDQLESVIVEQVDSQNYAFYLDSAGLMGNNSHYEVSAWRSDAWTNSGTVVTSISGNTISLDPNSVRSGGIRTTPYQPAFHITKGSTQTIPTGSQNTAITFGSVVVNVGGSFNTSTSRFTAPVAGNYYLGINIGYYGSGAAYARDLVSSIRVNGGTRILLNNQIVNQVTGNDHASHTVSGVVVLGKNDYVQPHIDYADHTGIAVAANSVFFGYLVG